jgi:galactokinase
VTRTDRPTNPLTAPTPSLTISQLKAWFTELYDRTPAIYRAPGRVNLIGEHTDYNEGFVMPAALDLYTYVAVSPCPDRRLRVYSDNFGETRDLDLDSIRPGKSGHWSDYVRGVAGALESNGHRVRGADLAIASEVPLGSGLSSSAALEVSVAFALLGNSQIKVDRKVIPQICQQAEHLYPETKCGIMDQFIACYGRAGHALMLDCRSLDFKFLTLPSQIRLVVCNTMVRHEHATSGYNTRRRECEEGLRALTEVLPGIRALRDVSLEALEKHSDRLAPLIYKRVRHVVTENDRVKKAARALEKTDVTQFGRLMAESHRSLRDDYEVSSPELDLMVDLANGQPGVYGTRMTGGGFGGCTVILVDAAQAAEIQQSLEQRYTAKTGLKPTILICEASDGAGPVEENGREHRAGNSTP